MASRMKKPENSCPLCKTELVDTVQVVRVAKEFEKEVSRRLLDSTRKQTSEFREAIKESKDQQRSEIQNQRTNSAEQMQELKDKFSATAKKEKAAHRVTLANSKKKAQADLRNLRDIYDREILRLQKEHESNFNTQLKEIAQNYGNVAAGQQKELERLKKVHDEDDSALRKKESEITKLKIDLVKASSRIEIKELLLQLHDRNDTIKRLNARITELEGRLGTTQRSPGAKDAQRSMSDEEQKEKLKEYMRAIIEITRNQQAEKKQNELGESEEKAEQKPAKSTMSKVSGWFF